MFCTVLHRTIPKEVSYEVNQSRKLHFSSTYKIFLCHSLTTIFFFLCWMRLRPFYCFWIRTASISSYESGYNGIWHLLGNELKKQRCKPRKKQIAAGLMPTGLTSNSWSSSASKRLLSISPPFAALPSKIGFLFVVLSSSVFSDAVSVAFFWLGKLLGRFFNILGIFWYFLNLNICNSCLVDKKNWCCKVSRKSVLHWSQYLSIFERCKCNWANLYLRRSTGISRRWMASEQKL